jgi:hypothetical protein
MRVVWDCRQPSTCGGGWLSVIVHRPAGCLPAGGLLKLTAVWVWPTVCRVQAEAQEQDCPPHNR